MDGQNGKKLQYGIEKIKPQVHAERCVVCNGFGTLKYGEKKCQACKGKGYILVPNFLPENENKNNSN